MRLLVRRSEVGCRRLRLDLAQWVNFGVSSCPYRPQTNTYCIPWKQLRSLLGRVTCLFNIFTIDVKSLLVKPQLGDSALQ